MLPFTRASESLEKRGSSFPKKCRKGSGLGSGSCSIKTFSKHFFMVLPIETVQLRGDSFKIYKEFYGYRIIYSNLTQSAMYML